MRHEVAVALQAVADQVGAMEAELELLRSKNEYLVSANTQLGTLLKNCNTLSPGIVPRAAEMCEVPEEQEPCGVTTTLGGKMLYCTLTKDHRRLHDWEPMD